MGESQKKDGATPKAPQNQPKPRPAVQVPGPVIVAHATGVEVGVIGDANLGDLCTVTLDIAGGGTLEVRFPVAVSPHLERALAESRGLYEHARAKEPGGLSLVEKKLIVPESRA